MAKLETDPAAAAQAKAKARAKSKAGELKEELMRAAKEILDSEYEDECGIAKIDAAGETLRALKDLTNLHRVKPLSSKRDLGDSAVPEEFRCPLSHDLMRDPVVLASGQTYDRSSIQKWLKSGNRTCPQTHQVLSHTILTPNTLIREMITQWCHKHGIRMPDDPAQYPDDGGITRADRERFMALIDKMSSTLDHKKEAAKELRSLTKRMPSFRSLFGESTDTISQLLFLLPQAESDLQEDLITTILNISIQDSNKKLVAQTPTAIPLLVDALRSGTIEAKRNAAAALFTLSALDSNKELIGKSGAMKPLVDLMQEGHPMAMKDVASAIFNLCVNHENKARAVKDGAVWVIVEKLRKRVCVDEMLAILAMLSGHYRAVNELSEHGAVGVLLGIIRDSDCGRNKENCIAILYNVCFNDRSKWKDMREEEKAHGTISQLAQDGTSRARRKAGAILERLNRFANMSHTA